MQHLVIPTDLSEASLVAALSGIRIMAIPGDRITLLHTYMQLNAGSALTVDLNAELLKVGKDGLRDIRTKLEGALDLSGYKVEERVEYGDLPKVLHRMAAEDASISMVIMGTHGASGVKKLLMGSNASDVIEASQVPVLVLSENGPVPIPAHVLFADDGGHLNANMLAPVKALAEAHGIEISIVHVSLDASDTVKTSHVASLLPGVKCTFHNLNGKDVTNALNAAAHELNADLIVLVHRHHGLFRDLFRTSVSAELAMLAQTPLLVLADKKGT